MVDGLLFKVEIKPNPISLFVPGSFERKDAGSGREEQPEQWAAVNQKEIGGNWKSEGRTGLGCILVS